MASSGGLKVYSKFFAKNFGLLEVSKKIKSKIVNEYQVAIVEVLGSDPEFFSQVDLQFDFQDCDKEDREKANIEKQKLQRDYGRLKERMTKNVKKRRPREFGFGDDEIFFDTADFKFVFKQKSETAKVSR